MSDDPLSQLLDAAAADTDISKDLSKPKAEPSEEETQELDDLLDAAAKGTDIGVDLESAAGEVTGWEKVKQGAGKMLDGLTLDSMLDRVTPDMIKDYEKGGIEEVIRGNARRSFVPGADIVARTMLGDDLETVIKEEVSASEAIKGAGELFGAALNPRLSPGMDIPIAKEAASAVGQAAVREALISRRNLEGDPAEWTPTNKAVVEAFEKSTGKKWVGPKRMKWLAENRPAEYRKVRNRQDNIATAAGNTIPEIFQAVIGLGIEQVRQIGKGKGTEFALTTAGTMAGTMMEDWAQTVSDPGARVLEDPLGMTLDFASFAGGPLAGRAVAGVDAAATVARGGKAADAAAAFKSARATLREAPVIRPGIGAGKEMVKPVYDMPLRALKDVAEAKKAKLESTTLGRAAASTIENLPSATRLERRIVDTLPEAVQGMLDVSRKARQKRTGETERVSDAVKPLRDESNLAGIRRVSEQSAKTLEDLFGEAAQAGDAAVLRVLETQGTINKKVMELQARKAMGTLDEAGAELLDTLSAVKSTDDVARFAASPEKMGLLDRDLRVALETQGNLDKLLKAIKDGTDAELAEAIRNSRGSVDKIRQAMRDLSEETAARIERGVQKIDEESAGRTRKAKKKLQEARARAEKPLEERVEAAEARASDYIQKVSANLKRKAVDVGELLQRQRKKSDTLDVKANKLLEEIDGLQARLDDMNADLNGLTRKGKALRGARRQSKKYNKIEQQRFEKLARLDEVLSEIRIVEDSIRKSKAYFKNFDKMAANEMSLARRIAKDMVAEANAKTEDALVRAKRSFDKFKAKESKHVIKRKESVRQLANERKAQKMSEYEARIESLRGLDEKAKYTFADREGLRRWATKEGAKTAEALQGMREVKRMLDNPESLKGNGAWLQLDGKVLGTAEAAARVLSGINAGRTPTELFDRVAVLGDDAAAVAIMKNAKETMRLSSEIEFGLLKHGVISPERFAVNFGRNLLSVMNPRNAEELTSAKIAKNPEIALLERSNLLAQLDFVRDVARLPGTVFDNSGFALKGRGFDEAGLPIYAKVKVRGEATEAAKLVTPEGAIDMVRVPKTMQQTGDLKFPKYGELAGQWVTRDTFDGLQKFTGYRADLLTRWGGVIKRIKVVDNLSSLVNMNVGNAASMAWDGINPATALPRALRMMSREHRNKGPEVDRMFVTEMRHNGIYEGTSSHHITGLAEADKLDSLSLKAAQHEANVGLGEKLGKALDLGGDVFSRKFNGFGGAVRWTWQVTDQAFRLATAEAKFKRLAKEKGYDITNVDGMRRALDDADMMDNVKKNTLIETLDYGEVPTGPRVFGRGVYEWAADTGFAPFIIYPLKAGGLWSRRFADAPTKAKLLGLAGEAQWQDQTPEERALFRAAQRPGEMGERRFITDNVAINTTPLNPVAFLPLEIARGMQKLGAGDGLGLMILEPLTEAFNGKTQFGQELWNPNEPAQNKLAKGFLHLGLSYSVSPSMQKVLPQVGFDRQGIAERYMPGQGPQRSVLTLEERTLSEAIARLFVNFDYEAKPKAVKRLMSAMKVRKRRAREARKLLNKGNLDGYYEASANADVEMAEAIGEVVRGFANR